MEPAWTPSCDNPCLLPGLHGLLLQWRELQWHQRSESEVRSLVFMYSMGQKGLVNLVSFHLSVVVSEKAQDTLLELKNGTS